MPSEKIRPDKNRQGFVFQKSLKESDPYPFLHYFRVERFMTRPLASLIVRAVFKTSVTPNQLTLVSFILGLASGIAFLGGSHSFFILGGILLQLSSILDCADGMLARSKDVCTRYGALLDLFCDRIVDFCVLTGIAFGWLRYSGNQKLFVAALISIGLYFLQVSLYYLMRHYQRKPTIGQAGESRGLSIFVTLILTILNRLDISILILAVYVVASLASKMIQLSRRKIRTDVSS
jgi:phosphatidylglycerophosphate synthase